MNCSILEKEVHKKYKGLTEYLISKGMTISTMESCTSGLIASLITDTEGSSAVLKGAFITYSNEAKIKQGVSEEIIQKYGVYSLETAREMADACAQAYGADIGIGITGSLGNVDPNNLDSVPGEVYVAVRYKAECRAIQLMIDAEENRFASKLSVANALIGFIEDVVM